MPLAAADAPETVARVHEGMPIVDLLAHQVKRQLGGGEIDDLRSAGHEGLLQAARSFDPSLGVPFRRWANLRVRGAMIDAMRAQGGVPRRVYTRMRAIEAGDRMSEAAAEEDAQKPTTTEAQADDRLSGYLAGLATAMAVGLIAEATTADGEDLRDTTLTAEEQLGEHQILTHVREALAALPESERHLVTRHYFDGLTFDEAAKELGLSKSWASRLHARAIEGLTRELKRQRVQR
ncbi:MAG TPA: sigma-70 family RNA polymerase sigma factor [Polyangiaceae bacterium]|jgi:RNA polymerase sigma factor for flagellar operon FliA